MEENIKIQKLIQNIQFNDKKVTIILIYLYVC